ncbi:MAG: cytochrome c3 family protein, partial [Nitrospirae bacterium]|nr:cytochrome c3 family protein [Nitrospirota bacterium]
AASLTDGLTAAIGTVTAGTDRVICLSCHRAHGSPYFKMLRWDYRSTTLATALSGCNACHTSKN